MALVFVMRGISKMASTQTKLEPNGVTIREAVAEDAPIMIQFLRELAEYQDTLEYFHAEEANLARDGFGPERQFETLIADFEGQPVGLATFLRTYSTWEGCAGFFIQDLFVAESVRGKMVGYRLVKEIARIARERGIDHLQLNVVHANPARDFYNKVGFEHMDDLLTYRLSQAKMNAFLES